jgi:hypothetical protein
MLELINTSAEVIEIGKILLGEGETHELLPDEANENVHANSGITGDGDRDDNTRESVINGVNGDDNGTSPVFMLDTSTRTGRYNTTQH